MPAYILLSFYSMNLHLSFWQCLHHTYYQSYSFLPDISLILFSTLSFLSLHCMFIDTLYGKYLFAGLLLTSAHIPFIIPLLSFSLWTPNLPITPSTLSPIHFLMPLHLKDLIPWIYFLICSFKLFQDFICSDYHYCQSV